MLSFNAILARSGTPVDFATMSSKITISTDPEQKTCYACCVDTPNLPHRIARNAGYKLRCTTAVSANFGIMTAARVYITAMTAGSAALDKAWEKISSIAR